MGIWEAVHQLYANTLKKDLRMGRLWCAQWDPGAIFPTQRDDCVFMATCVRSVILPDPSVLANYFSEVHVQGLLPAGALQQVLETLELGPGKKTVRLPHHALERCCRALSLMPLCIS